MQHVNKSLGDYHMRSVLKHINVVIRQRSHSSATDGLINQNASEQTRYYRQLVYFLFIFVTKRNTYVDTLRISEPR